MGNMFVVLLQTLPMSRNHEQLRNAIPTRARLVRSRHNERTAWIRSTAGDFFEPLRPWVNNLERLLPHAPFRFLGARDTFHLQKVAASTLVARSAPPHIVRR
jgi:hypothetical protein